MSCHSRDGFKSTTRLASAISGMDRDEVKRNLHILNSEATGSDLPPPSQDDIDEWYRDSLAALDATDLKPVAKDSIARGLLRARFEQPAPDGREFYVQRQLIARCIQQQVVKNAPGLVQMDPPGSQADQYERDTDGRPAKVWYASYGSNLYVARMNCYIEGGSPNGGKTNYEGARDKTPVQATIPVALPGTVHYAGESGVWTGGPAFLDTSTRGQSLGRAHLITASQFDDVVEQESNSSAPPTGVKVDTLDTIKNGKTVGNGVYGTLVHVGDYQGAPVMTFTSPFSVKDALRGDMVYTPENTLVPAAGREQIQAQQKAAVEAEAAAAKAEGRAPKRIPADWPVFTNPPAKAYTDMIGGGLTETFGLSEVQKQAYFAGAPSAPNPKPSSDAKAA